MSQIEEKIGMVCDRNTDTWASVIGCCVRRYYTNADTHTYANANTDPNADADPYADTNANANSNANRGTDGNTAYA